jgi:hypothetical protein
MDAVHSMRTRSEKAARHARRFEPGVPDFGAYSVTAYRHSTGKRISCWRKMAPFRPLLQFDIATKAR